MIWWYWLMAALIFLLFELSSPGLFLFLSFSCGALFGALASWLGYSFAMQSIIALFGTICSLVILTRWVKGQLHRFTKEQHTNIYALIGKRGYILKKVTPEKFGQAKINGEVWSCKSTHQEEIEIGQEIEVVQVSGSHIVVKKITALINQKGKP